MRSYESSRLTQPLIDRAHRLLDASNKRSPLKRSFKAVGEHFADPTMLPSEFRADVPSTMPMGSVPALWSLHNLYSELNLIGKMFTPFSTM